MRCASLKPLYQCMLDINRGLVVFGGRQGHGLMQSHALSARRSARRSKHSSKGGTKAWEAPVDDRGSPQPSTHMLQCMPLKTSWVQLADL